MRSRKIIYAVEHDIIGGYTIYGENGIRRITAKSVAKAVRLYEAQAECEEAIAMHDVRLKRLDTKRKAETPTDWADLDIKAMFANVL